MSLGSLIDVFSVVGSGHVSSIERVFINSEVRNDVKESMTYLTTMLQQLQGDTE
jgi:pheromone shutdown protein TraB